MLPEKIVHHIVKVVIHPISLLGLDLLHCVISGTFTMFLWGRTCTAEENVEAICQFFNTSGKQLDESPKSRRVNDIYFSRLKELTTNPQLVQRLRFMVRDVLDLQADNWVPRREEVKAKDNP